MAFLTMTATVTVNPAFLQEIKEGNHELWRSLADLRHRCSCPITTGMCRHLVNSLSEFRDQLTMHFALEEAFGYFDEPLHVEPQLSEKAGRLRSEHQELYSEISDLVGQAERMFYAGQTAALAHSFGPHFLEFDARLRYHEEQENELVWEAFNRDIGGGED